MSIFCAFMEIELLQLQIILTKDADWQAEFQG
ncbi:hypothetical protein AGR6A_Cc60482 [Agrobacterium sp. NCPPB 925]|nr:hypothetical protein AGR6A_Cc60482 [Agrobacterium sp. NCPPB 925]